MPYWDIPRTSDEMSGDERLAWLLQYWHERLIKNEIDRVFQRLYYFLVASAFLLAGFAQLAASQDCHDGTEERAAIAGVLLGAGLLLSAAFYAINCWNTHIVWAYSDWIEHGNRQHPQPAWIAAGRVPCLRQGFSEMKHAFDEILHPDVREIFLAVLRDVFNVKRPAWFARYVPWVLFFVWFTLARVVFPGSFLCAPLWHALESCPCFPTQTHGVLWLGLIACLLPTGPLVFEGLFRLLKWLFRPIWRLLRSLVRLLRQLASRPRPTGHQV